MLSLDAVLVAVASGLIGAFAARLLADGRAKLANGDLPPVRINVRINVLADSTLMGPDSVDVDEDDEPRSEHDEGRPNNTPPR